VNRLRALVIVLAAAVAVAAGLTVYAFRQSDSSQRQARIATARQLSAASVANLDVDPQLSLLLAMRAVEGAKVGGAPLPDAVDALHRALAASRAVLMIRTPATGALAVSPNGSRIVTAGSSGIAENVGQFGNSVGSRDRQADAETVDVWDARTGKRVLSLDGVTAPVHDVVYTPDGSRIVTGDDDGMATVWDARTGKRLYGLPDPGEPGGFFGVGVSRDGTKLATSDRLGHMRIWDLTTRRLVRTIRAREPVCGVAWSPDGTLVGAGQCGAYNFSFASAARVWDVRTGRLVFKTTGLPAGPVLQFSPDGRHLVAPTLSGTAEIWDVGTQRLVATLTGHSGQVDAVAYSSDGRLVATGGTDGTARVWDASSGKALLVLRGHSAALDAVQFTPDSRRLVTSSEDGTVRVWDVTTQGSRDWLTLDAHPGGVVAADFIRDGRQVMTRGDCDGKEKVWNAETGTLISTSPAPRDVSCPQHPSGQRAAADVGSTSGRIVAQATDNGSVELLDATTGTVVRTLPGGHEGVQAITFDGSGKRIATGNWDGTAIVWDVESGRPMQTFAAHDGIVESVTFSPDGRVLATAGEDATAKLWDLKTGDQLVTLTGHTFALTDVEFSPDGTRLATASGDGTVRIYVLPVSELLAVARARLTRTWTAAECRTYLPGGHCPAHT
jgi:WD40 repeat protein